MDTEDSSVGELSTRNNEEDSNVYELVPRKKNKEKERVKTPEINVGQNKKLSKSQKRKLKKLAEEKEQAQLLSKSLETLERTMINEEAYSLLMSSQNIGQAMTLREKRRRDMLLSKAGLELPSNDQHVKKRKVDSCEEGGDACENTSLALHFKNSISQPIPTETKDKNNVLTWSMPSQGSDNQICAGDHDISGGATDGVTSEDTHRGLPDYENLPNDRGDDSDVDSHEERDVGVDPIQQTLAVPTIVHVSRPKEVEDARKDLPIIMMEQEIMEAINRHISVIICGETGCGKTTQVPQFLHEAGYGSKKCSVRSGVIGVTQPRRVAVLSTARRVAYELGLRLGKEVGFQVRHDKRIGENCSIKFMTDGILLRELQNDFLLKRYSVLILDEAHERSLNTDILIGMLSRVIRQRQAIYEDQQKRVLSGDLIRDEDKIFPLKLILMSATLRVEDFTSGRQIFPAPPPVIEIPTRQFPVVKHFAKKTELVDYIGEAYRKVLKIHKRLPPGGILVFVTGQKEVEYLCHKLRNVSKQFQSRSSEVCKEKETDMTHSGQIDGFSMKEISEAVDAGTTSTKQEAGRFSCYDESDNDDSYSADSSGVESDLDSESDDEDLADQVTSKADDSFLDFSEDVNLDSLKAAFESLTGKSSVSSESGDKEMNSVMPTEENGGEKRLVGPLHVLPLYAMLPAAAQLRVFDDIREGERLVVVATNVAETSLTIPGITYVVDTGREKVKSFNLSNGMESYDIQWISKASAAQRAGRAGRTGPGHCYCLYSSAAFANEFPEFSDAEILKIPVDGVVLLMKSMGISKVANFPFPTPPDATALVQAERCLKALEALDTEGRLTHLGKTMAQYPMSPRHSRLLLLAIHTMKEISHVRQNLVLGYAVAVAAALSLSNPFLFQFDSSHTDTEMNKNEEDTSFQDQKHKSKRKQMKESVKLSSGKFFNLKSDALTIAYALQCFEQSKDASGFCNEYLLHLKTMEEMSKLRKQLLQLVFHQRYNGPNQEFSWTHGTIEDVEQMWRVSSEKNPLYQIEEDILCQAICAGWVDRVAKRTRGTKGFVEEVRKVNAIRYKASMVEETVFLHRWSAIAKAAPEFLVYNEMLQTKRPYIRGATSVASEWLVKYGSALCTFSTPLTDPKPFYDCYHDQVFCYAIPYFGPHSWELPACKLPIKDVQQRVVVFAYALLDGQVFPCLKSVKKFMAASPNSILKPEALSQKRVGNLLSKLKTRSRTIDSCSSLNEAWKDNPRLLHSEIMDWFQDGFRSAFEELWENMHREVVLAPEDRFHDSSKKKKKGLKKR